MIDVVEMVLGGKVNKEIVSLISRHGGNAVGITGKDGDLIQAKKHKRVKHSPETNRPEIIDMGLVGEVSKVNPKILEVLHQNEFIPVIAPTGKGIEGETLNINADFVAAAVASALKAEKLVLMTDTAGVQRENGAHLKLFNSRLKTILTEGASRLLTTESPLDNLTDRHLPILK